MNQEMDVQAALEALVAASESASKQQPANPLPPRTDDVPLQQQIIPDREYSGPARKDGATIATEDPLFSSPAPAPKEAAGASVPSPVSMAGTLPAPLVSPVSASPAPAAFMSTVNYQKLFFTGRTGVGKDWLAKQVQAHILDSSAPLVAAARAVFPAAKAEHFLGLFPTVHAWGEGIISKDYPLTPARWLFVKTLGEQWPGFGTAGFWVRLLLETAAAVEGRVAITNVSSPGAFKALKEAGFTHFHVMTSPAEYVKRVKRPNANDQLANALDQDAVKKVSAQRQGDKLPVVWNAPEAPPSERLWTVAQFLAAIGDTPTAADSFGAFE